MPVRVLLVEDNDAIREMLTRRLERRGYLILPATDGAQGVALARDEAPDLILLDIGLPVMDGLDAARWLKAAPETARIPIIALTAHASTADRDSALAAGCDEFETKPVELPRLLAKMEALLG